MVYMKTTVNTTLSKVINYLNIYPLKLKSIVYFNIRKILSFN